MAGFQVRDACYSTALEAAQAVASAQQGSLIEHAGRLYTVGITSVTSNSIGWFLNPVGGGQGLDHPQGYFPQPCNLLQATDGITLGWMVAAPILATWAVMFIIRALRGESESTYGNS